MRWLVVARAGYAGFAGHLRSVSRSVKRGLARLGLVVLDGACSVRAARPGGWSRSIRLSVALLLVTQRPTRGAGITMDDTRGFKVAADAPAIVHADISDAVREQVVRMLAGIVSGATPEEVACYLVEGWPEVVVEMLDRVGEVDEMSAHVDLIAGVLLGV